MSAEKEYEFYNQYSNRPKYNGLKIRYEKVVDTLGFIPHKEKINNYINAGINLTRARIEQYDADSNVKPEDIAKNPFRDIGMDFADAHRQKQKLVAQIEARIKAQKEKIEQENQRLSYLEKNKVINLENGNKGVTEGQKTAP